MQGDICAVLHCPGKPGGENQACGGLSSDLCTLIQVTHVGSVQVLYRDAHALPGTSCLFLIASALLQASFQGETEAHMPSQCFLSSHA